MLRAQFFDDRRTGRGLIADHLHAGFRLEGVDNLLREAVGIGRERLLKRKSRDFPMSRGGILSGGAFVHHAVAADGFILAQRMHIDGFQKPQFRKIRYVRMHLRNHMTQRIRALIAVLCRVRLPAGAHAVQYDQYNALHFIHVSSLQS